MMDRRASLKAEHRDAGAGQVPVGRVSSGGGPRRRLPGPQGRLWGLGPRTWAGPEERPRSLSRCHVPGGGCLRPGSAESPSQETGSDGACTPTAVAEPQLLPSGSQSSLLTWRLSSLSCVLTNLATGSPACAPRWPAGCSPVPTFHLWHVHGKVPARIFSSLVWKLLYLC